VYSYLLVFCCSWIWLLKAADFDGDDIVEAAPMPTAEAAEELTEESSVEEEEEEGGKEKKKRLGFRDRKVTLLSLCLSVCLSLCLSLSLRLKV